MAVALKPPVVKPASTTPIKPKPQALGDDMKMTHERLVVPNKTLVLPGQEVWLKSPDGKGNWNIATEGLAYYDTDLFVRGTGLLDGQTLTVQPFIVTGGGKHRSGYFPQEVHGSEDGEFYGQVRFKTPLLSTSSVEILVKASAPATITSYGSDTFAFHL
jgi:hypothetical protein